jgi:GNAT superfamily N-acetyltransferase
MRECYSIKLSIAALAVADLQWEDEGVYWLTRINVPRAYRRRGVGTRLLKRILRDANREEATIKLGVVCSDRTMGQRALRAWYKKHGFKPTETQDVLIYKGASR